MVFGHGEFAENGLFLCDDLLDIAEKCVFGFLSPCEFTLEMEVEFGVADAALQGFEGRGKNSRAIHKFMVIRRNEDIVGARKLGHRCGGFPVLGHRGDGERARARIVVAQVHEKIDRIEVGLGFVQYAGTGIHRIGVELIANFDFAAGCRGWYAPSIGIDL